MRCATGTRLLHDYERAVRLRSLAKDQYDLASFAAGYSDVNLNSTKQIFGDTLVAWVTHRAFCLQCRSHLGRSERVLFAAV